MHAALIRLLLPDVDEQVERFGSELHINKREEAGYWRAHRLARSSPFLWREMGALISLALILQPGDTFVDVGANVGLFSSCLVRFRKLQPAVRFYAFEANRDTAIMTGRGFSLYDARSLKAGPSSTLLAIRTDELCCA